MSRASRSRGPSGERRPVIASGHGPAVVLVSHSYVDEDPRVRREAEALAAAGWSVDVIGLRRPGEAARGTVGGARLRRLNVQRHQGAPLSRYLLEYLSFFVRVAAQLLVDQRRRHYALVQVATLPDWLVFAALPLRLGGVPVVLDLHEAMPEFFASRFGGFATRPAHRLLLAAERGSILAASHVLTANHALRDRLVGLGLPGDRITVVPNAPSLAWFDPAGYPDRTFMADGTLRLLYAGALTPTYEPEVMIQAVALVRQRRPELRVALDVYGRGDSDAELGRLIRELDLGGLVTLHGRIALDAVPAAIAAGDVGLAPVARTAFTELSFSTKLLEYGAMRRPVVAGRLPLAERLLGPDAVTFYTPGDAASLAEAILGLLDDPETRARRILTMAERVAGMSWEVEQVPYVALIDRIAREPRSAQRSAGA